MTTPFTIHRNNDQFLPLIVKTCCLPMEFYIKRLHQLILWNQIESYESLPKDTALYGHNPRTFRIAAIALFF